MKKIDISYSAAAIDGEGTVHLSSHRSQVKNRFYEYLKPVIRVSNTNKEFILYLENIYKIDRINSTQRKGQKRVFYWTIRAKEDLKFLIKKVQPFLIIKRKQAYLMLQFLEENTTKKTPRNISIAKEICKLNTGKGVSRHGKI